MPNLFSVPPKMKHFRAIFGSHYPFLFFTMTVYIPWCAGPAVELHMFISSTRLLAFSSLEMGNIHALPHPSAWWPHKGSRCKIQFRPTSFRGQMCGGEGNWDDEDPVVQHVLQGSWGKREHKICVNVTTYTMADCWAAGRENKQQRTNN